MPPNVVCIAKARLLLDELISQSEPELEPGGVGGRRGDELLLLISGLASGLAELRRAARVTFLAAATLTVLTLPFFRPHMRLVPEIEGPSPRVGPPAHVLLEIPLPARRLSWCPLWWLRVIALDIGMHGKHSASMSIASVNRNRDANGCD